MSSVLIVDDSPIDRKVAGGLLKKIKDIQIEYAVSGEEALQKIRQHEPQVVVTDLIMPGMDGLALVAAVVSEFPLIPVILMTGKGSEEVAVKALQEGAASYVPKGLLSDMLVETVQNLLTVAREQRQHVQLMNCIVETDWKFELGNDWNMIPHLVNYVHQGVRSVGLCDETESIRVSVALEEALNNAIFHGNLELNSELRENDRAEYRRLIRLRCENDPYRDRKVHVNVKLTPQHGHFIIRDDGPGFDPHSLPDPTEPANLEKASGRGVLLMRTFMDDITYNDQGNQVTMKKYASLPKGQQQPQGKSS